MSNTQHKSSSKSNPTTTGSGKTGKSSKSTLPAANLNAKNRSGAARKEPVGGQVLLPVTEIEQQLHAALNGDLNQKHLQEALRNAQELIGKLKTEVKRLSTRVSDMELSQNASVKKSAENELHTEITRLGASFQFLYSPFQKPKFDLFSSDHPEPHFGPHDPTRYDNALNQELGAVAELYAHVDTSFHSFMMEGQVFGDTFLAGVSSARSSSLERVKTAASNIFDLGVKQNLFGKDSETTKRRMENLHVRKLLALDLSLENQVVPPLLYLNEDATDITKLFLNPLLMKMARIVLYGPSMAGKPNALLRASSPFFGRAKVTPGLIAWCAIVARYLLSPDTELSSSGIGFHSKYDYPTDFENYKMMIILAQINNRSWYRKLIRVWDRTLFPAGNNGSADKDDSDADSATREAIGTTAVTDLMQRMKIAASNTTSESDSESELSNSAPQRNTNTFRRSPLTTESSDDEIEPLPRASLPPSPPPPPQPKPKARPITKAPRISDDDPYIISYVTPLPPPRPQPSVQNLEFQTSDVILQPIPQSARLRASSLTLDSEPLTQAQNVDTPPDSPLSELADAADRIPVIQPITSSSTQSAAPVHGQSSKVRKSKAPNQDHPGPARRSGRTKATADLNATEKGEGGSRNGKGRNRHRGN